MALAAAAATVAACNDSGERSSGVTAPPARDVNEWLGRWIGPEGTYLELDETAEGYRVQIHSLDGSAVYAGRAVPAGIAFERDGVTQTLRATDGAGTGMKWLLDKSRCLTIRTGEGFCRD
jgi:hypothetical protein